MAISDPTMSVPTPTGILQGVAVFNWDGAVWQPAGRASPTVATATGNLQGVAAFTGGPSWAPSGRSGPGVATPTGVLDGVAVYTWSGSQWTPPGGSPTPSTPSGALRGVAAFDWDGSAWQPAGQAGPDVPTPYGVLQGVARFGWTGTAWAAVGAPSFQCDFLSGSLGAGAVFTRASTGTYYDSAGVLRTATTNSPRFDYDPVTLQLKGLLLEDASVNNCLQSNAGVAPWQGFATGVAPVATANNTTAPDGTLTGTRLVFSSVSGAGAVAVWYQGTGTKAPSTFSVFLKGDVGGEQIYISMNDGVAPSLGSPRLTLATQWQRFSFTITTTTPNAGWSVNIGTILSDATNAPTPAQTIYAWGGQLEVLAYMTSLMPTTTVATARAADVLSYPVASVTGFSTTQGSFAHEYILEGASIGFGSPAQFVGSTSSDGMDLDEYYPTGSTGTTPNTNAVEMFVGGAAVASCAFVPVIPTPAGPVHRGASSWALNAPMRAAHDGVANATNSGNAASLPVIANLTIAGPLHTQAPVSQWARRMRYWPRQLSQSELISVTS